MWAGSPTPARSMAGGNTMDDILSFLNNNWADLQSYRNMYGDQFMPMMNMAWQQSNANRSYGLEAAQLAQQKAINDARMAEEARQFNANYGLKSRELNADLFAQAAKQAGATIHPATPQNTMYITDRWGQLMSPYSLGGGIPGVG